MSADSSEEKQAAVERVIAMAASLANAALGQELAVGVCAWDGKPVWLSPLRGKQQREEVLTAARPVAGQYDLSERSTFE